MLKPTSSSKKDDEEIKRIRVNNCFAKADKESLNTNKKKWEEYINNESELDCKIYSYIIDSKVVAASDKQSPVTIPRCAALCCKRMSIIVLSVTIHKSV